MVSVQYSVPSGPKARGRSTKLEVRSLKSEVRSSLIVGRRGLEFSFDFCVLSFGQSVVKSA